MHVASLTKKIKSTGTHATQTSMIKKRSVADTMANAIIKIVRGGTAPSRLSQERED
jgi:hypothetical protein